MSSPVSLRRSSYFLGLIALRQFATDTLQVQLSEFRTREGSSYIATGCLFVAVRLFSRTIRNPRHRAQHSVIEVIDT